jgi:hypothetical protein
MRASGGVGQLLELDEQRALWRRQSISLPSLRGGKRIRYDLLTELIGYVAAGRATPLDSSPTLSSAMFETSIRPRGASPSSEAQTWREYGQFLRSIGYVRIQEDRLELTDTGTAYSHDPTPVKLALSLSNNYRLFAESLSFLQKTAATVEDLDIHLRERYSTSWTTLGGARDRLDWLDALGLVENAGARQWVATEAGKSVLEVCMIVEPDAVTISAKKPAQLPEVPPAIAELLNLLVSDERKHASRSTYNIWVPSPSTHPNKIENLRLVVNAASERVSRQELTTFITQTFALKKSSIDSMMPFLRASGLLQEVGLNIYEATAPAKAWLSSQDNVDFVRVLHAHIQFVGEMISYVAGNSSRADLYDEALRFGQNKEKCRWIIQLLHDAEVLETPGYLKLAITPLGQALLGELPLAPTPASAVDGGASAALEDTEPSDTSSQPDLATLARTPNALGLPPGKAFEDAVQATLTSMSFSARPIGGPGDTDIVASWIDGNLDSRTAIVEVKSRSNGHVAHGDVSDVALETHKRRHQADFVVIVGPSFAGDTIKNMAQERNWALIEAQQLLDAADEARALGLAPHAVALLFDPTEGPKALNDLIGSRRRQLAVTSFVIEQLAAEASDTGEPITARDISRDGRRSDLRPDLDEVGDSLKQLSIVAPEAIRVVDQNDDLRFSGYALGDVRAAADRLRALAKALDSAAPDTPGASQATRKHP